MAAPSYTTDLTDITLAENTTGWSRYGIAGNPGQGADFSMQGTFCVDKQVSNGDGGVHYNNGAGITLGAGDHVWVWHFTATPGITATIQNKGASIMVGTAAGTTLTAACEYHVAGNDTFGAGGRVARCYPIDYSVRTTNASPPYRTASGTPGANPQYFGGGMVTTATARTNLGIDAIRYGTGGFLSAGELISAGDASDNPCTFAGFQSQNDAIANRWGILTGVGGGYELQGTFAIGQNNAGTATLCRFQDSDKNIVIADTIHAANTFNRFVIDHASTVCNWSNISITALGTTAPGQITVTATNPTFSVTGGTWTGLGSINLRSNSSLDGVTLRSTGQVTLNGATLQNSLIDKNTASAAVVTTAANMANVTGNTFISDGTGHAVDLGTVSASTSITWDNELSGYVAGATGSPITPGTSGNEAILVNVASGQTLTINVAAGATIPSVKNDGTGAVNVVAGLVTLTLTGLVSNTEVRIYSAGTTTELTGVENSGTSFEFTYTYVANTFVDIVIHNVGYEYIRLDDVLLGSSNASLPIQQVPDRWYSNP